MMAGDELAKSVALRALVGDPSARVGMRGSAGWDVVEQGSGRGEARVGTRLSEGRDDFEQVPRRTGKRYEREPGLIRGSIEREDGRGK